MNRKPGTDRPARIGQLALLVLLASALPLQAQQAVPRTAEAPLEAAPARTADVPYAVRVDALFSELARKAEYPQLIEAWAKERGLDPASVAVQELVAAAFHVGERHPWRLTPEDRETLLQRFAGDEEGLRLWRQEQKTRRYRAVGVAWGQWLEARQGEGYPPEFLTDRLLILHPPTVLTESRGSEEELARQHRSEVRAFEEGLRSVRATVARRPGS